MKLYIWLCLLHAILGAQLGLALGTALGFWNAWANRVSDNEEAIWYAGDISEEDLRCDTLPKAGPIVFRRIASGSSIGCLTGTVLGAFLGRSLLRGRLTPSRTGGQKAPLPREPNETGVCQPAGP
jgi:ABC-type nitrate/sulfonate/bicarbonate transport system permease component